MSGTPGGASERADVRSREMPLDPNLVARTDLDVAASCGVIPAETSRRRRTRNLVLGQLLLLSWIAPSGWLFYSRDRNVYATQRRYFGGTISYSLIDWAVATLCEAGLAIERRAAKGPHSQWRSR